MTDLRERLSPARILLAPGVYDALGALMAARAGFEAVYLSGAGIAYTRLGRPDIGLVDMSEVAATCARIRERVDLPIVADADTGYGNALNVQRTVFNFERAGAAAVQLEDQTLPKRCGHLRGKRLVPAGEMVGKIKAALDARTGDGPLVIARTDAIAVEGFEAALERAERYAEAGADVLFVEAPRTKAELEAVGARFRDRVPVMANMVEGGLTPVLPAAELERLGFSLVIFPSGLPRAVVKLMETYFATLKRDGTTAGMGDLMLDFQALQKRLGTEEMLAAGAGYDADNFD